MDREPMRPLVPVYGLTILTINLHSGNRLCITQHNIKNRMGNYYQDYYGVWVSEFYDIKDFKLLQDLVDNYNLYKDKLDYLQDLIVIQKKRAVQDV